MATLADKSAKIAELTNPVYQRIESDLRKKVESGEWQAGMMIPGRHRLSAEYDVHQRTIDRAIRALVAEGTLETQGTRGTFVSRRLPVGGSSFTSRDALLAAPLDAPVSDVTTRLCVIGVIIVDDQVSRDEEDILRSLEKAVSGSGSIVIYLDRSAKPGKAMPLCEAADRLVDQGAEAIVVVAYNASQETLETFDVPFGTIGVPLIYVSPTIANWPCWNVYYDNVDAGYIATMHLIEKGCSSFLFVADNQFQWAQERLNGMRNALRRSSVAEKRLTVRFAGPYCGSDPEHFDLACAMGREIFAAGTPQGILAANDHMARGVLQAAAEMGLRAGVDFLVAAFDDSEHARSLGLTSMRPPLVELGRSAAQLAITALSGDQTSQKICWTSHLITRTTTNWLASK
ncbi:MAG TPA: GntR family transcriptional regulator [Capsulimonadaceae bacterium]|jgi:DNA-binding LacI/PurR family transcriptional regulator/DNA-binding transcriptional regulator YhcF (GntR family)